MLKFDMHPRVYMQRFVRGNRLYVVKSLIFIRFFHYMNELYFNKHVFIEVKEAPIFDK